MKKIWNLLYALLIDLAVTYHLYDVAIAFFCLIVFCYLFNIEEQLRRRV